MPLKRSQAVPFVAKEVCRQSYTFENEWVSNPQHVPNAAEDVALRVRRYIT
jgi:hypothetical protein